MEAEHSSMVSRTRNMIHDEWNAKRIRVDLCIRVIGQCSAVRPDPDMRLSLNLSSAGVVELMGTHRHSLPRVYTSYN